MNEAGEGRDRAVRFGAYELDLGTGELWREGGVVELAPQPTRLLVLLARHPGRLVTRDRIREEIWGDDVVEFDAAINHAIRGIRAALGDDASDPRYVETVPRRGYRLMASTVEARDEPEGRGTLDSPNAADDQRADHSPGAGSGKVRTPDSRPVWPWATALGMLLILLLLALSRSLSSPGVPTVIVLPARASVADSPADSLAGALTLALDAGLKNLEPGGIRLLEWTGPVVYDPEARALMKNGEDLGVDIVVEANLSVRADSLRAGVSLTSVGTGTQLWYRTFMHPLDDPEGAVARIRERVVEEVRGRVSS